MNKQLKFYGGMARTERGRVGSAVFTKAEVISRTLQFKATRWLREYESTEI